MIRPLVGAVYPEWWGAVADGATDCTSAIQSALDACGRGGVVQLSSGRYRVTDTLRPAKYPGNCGVFGVCHLRGVGAAAVDDLVGAENYGSTLYAPGVSTVLDLTGTRGPVVESLSIVGTIGPTPGTVAIRSDGWTTGARLRDVALWGWDSALRLSGAVNNDDWLLCDCRIHYCSTAIRSEATEAYLVRVRGGSVGHCETFYHCIGNATGAVMNSLAARDVLIACTAGPVIRYSSPSAPHNGRAIISLDECVIEAASGVPALFVADSGEYAGNPLGLKIRGCVINTGGNPPDPDFRFIRYRGLGPFEFTGNIVDGPTSFPVEIVTSVYPSSVPVAASWGGNVFRAGPPAFITPPGLPEPSIRRWEDVVL